MDVLIQLTGSSYLDGETIRVQFRAFVKLTGHPTFPNFDFDVAYDFDATANTRRNAVIAALNNAVQDYAAAAGVTIPPVSGRRVQVLGF